MNGDQVPSLGHDATSILLIVILWIWSNSWPVRGGPWTSYIRVYELNSLMSKVYVIVLRCVSLGLDTASQHVTEISKITGVKRPHDGKLPSTFETLIEN